MPLKVTKTSKDKKIIQFIKKKKNTQICNLCEYNYSVTFCIRANNQAAETRLTRKYLKYYSIF